MSAAILFGLYRGVTVGSIAIDAVTAEEHTGETNVTDHAVEPTDGVSGYDISDHMKQLPDRLTMEGVLSDSPTTITEFVEKTFSGDRARDRYDRLLALKETAEPFDVVTLLRVYEQMVFEQITVIQSAQTGDSISFRATLKEVRFAVSERTAVAVPSASALVNGQSKLGPKGATESPVASQKQSLLDRTVAEPLLGAQPPLQ